jgi:hypothetical protein
MSYYYREIYKKCRNINDDWDKKLDIIWYIIFIIANSTPFIFMFLVVMYRKFILFPIGLSFFILHFLNFEKYIDPIKLRIIDRDFRLYYKIKMLENQQYEIREINNDKDICQTLKDSLQHKFELIDKEIEILNKRRDNLTIKSKNKNAIKLIKK